MALGKQAKVLTKAQIDTLLLHVGNGRNPVRNRLIVLLSVKAGLCQRQSKSEPKGSVKCCHFGFSMIDA